MALPVIYRKHTEPSIISYDFIDAMEGLGFIKYYALNGSAADRKLVRYQLASPVWAITNTYTTAALTIAEDIDWDLDFIIPQVVGGGDLLVNASIESEGYGGGYNDTSRLDVYVYKVDAAAAETLIGSASGAIMTFGAETAGTRGSHRILTKVTLPKTKIKCGEKLRVNTKWFLFTNNIRWFLWTDGEARGTTAYYQFNYDNENIKDFKNRTDLVVTIPFKLQI